MQKIVWQDLLCGFLLPAIAATLWVLAIPVSAADAKPATRLTEAQAVRTARTFCAKIGQTVTVSGTATFAEDTNAQDPPNHYWQQVWEITFPGQAKVEVADATSVITNYENSAYFGVHRGNTPAGEAISQKEAVQQARKAVDAAGQPEPLLFWEEDEEQRHPSPPFAETHDWMVRWHRAARGIPYRDQHVSVGLDAETGEIKGMTIMYGSPPLVSARQMLSRDDAISVAASQVISQVVQENAAHKETHLEIISPDNRWSHTSDKPGQPISIRLAWITKFTVDGGGREVDVDAENGDILGVGADPGPLGGQTAGAPAAVPTPPSIAAMLHTVHMVYVRGKDGNGKWDTTPLLKFSTESQPHAVAILSRTVDFRTEVPSGAASRQVVLVSRSQAMGVYSYFPETGLLGSRSEWAAVPTEFRVWMQHLPPGKNVPVKNVQRKVSQ